MLRFGSRSAKERLHLHEVTLRRAQASATAHALCAALLWLAVTSFAPASLGVSTAACLIIGLAVARGAVARRYRNQVATTWRRSSLLHSAVVVAATPAWVWLIASVLSLFGIGHPAAFLALLFGSATAAASVSSLGAEPGTGLAFLLLMIGGSAAALLGFGTSPGHLWLAAGLAAFLVVNVRQLALQYSILLESLRHKITAEERSRELTQTFQSIPGHVAVLDRSEIYRASNGVQLERLFTASTIIGRRLGDVERSPEFVRAVREFLAANCDDGLAEVELAGDSDDKQWWLLSMRKLRDTEAGGALLILIDIQAQKMAETLLNTERAKAQHATRLASLGEMAGGVAHEINNPLAIIQGNAHLLLRLLDGRVLDAEAARVAADRITDTTRRIAKIIKGLRIFARSDENQPNEEVSVTAVIEDTFSLCQERFKAAGIRLSCTYHADPGTLRFDGHLTQIMQVLVNLLNNAHDAVIQGVDPWIEVAVTRVEERIQVSVTDSGPGVPQAIRGRIMEPFFTTKDIGKGTGLGLSIAKGIVESHGGRFWLDEAVPNTRFLFELPAIVGDAATPGASVETRGA